MTFTATSTATVLRTDARAAARLVAFAMQPRLMRGAEPDYDALCVRYRSEVGFAELVDDVADGLELIVLGLTDTGLIVAPHSDSFLRYKLAEFTESMRGFDTKRRTFYGLVMCAIAASAYPRESDLDDTVVVRRSVTQICDLLAATANIHETDDAPPSDDPADEPMWRIVTTIPRVHRNRSGRIDEHCQQRIVERVFDWLIDQGMANRTPVEGTYQLLDRFRVHARELAGHDAITALRTTLAGQPEVNAPACGEEPT